MITELTKTCFAALTEPSVETYEKIYNSRYASLQEALVWIIVSALLSTILNITGAALLPYDVFNTALILDIIGNKAYIMQWLANPWIQIFLASWIAPAIFLLIVFTQHTIAQALRGNGESGRYSYVIAIINSPFTLIFALIRWLPPRYPTSLTYLILVVYYYSLTIIATKAVYKLSIGRSIVAVLGMFFIPFLLLMCMAVFFFAYTLHHLFLGSFG